MYRVNLKILNNISLSNCYKVVIMKENEIIKNYIHKNNEQLYLDKGVYKVIINNMCTTIYVYKDIDIVISLNRMKRYIFRLLDENYLNLPIDRGLIKFE